jgi:hypothetical protein
VRKSNTGTYDRAHIGGRTPAQVGAQAGETKGARRRIRGAHASAIEAKRYDVSKGVACWYERERTPTRLTVRVGASGKRIPARSRCAPP